jgi:hypothetical protein
MLARGVACALPVRSLAHRGGQREQSICLQLVDLLAVILPQLTMNRAQLLLRQ